LLCVSVIEMHSSFFALSRLETTDLGVA